MQRNIHSKPSIILAATRGLLIYPPPVRVFVTCTSAGHACPQRSFSSLRIPVWSQESLALRIVGIFDAVMAISKLGFRWDVLPGSPEQSGGGPWVGCLDPTPRASLGPIVRADGVVQFRVLSGPKLDLLVVVLVVGGSLCCVVCGFRP